MNLKNNCVILVCRSMVNKYSRVTAELVPKRLSGDQAEAAIDSVSAYSRNRHIPAIHLAV